MPTPILTKQNYFNSKPHPPEHDTNAGLLLPSVNDLHARAAEDGAYGYWIDPDTGTQVSGAKGGSGDGAYRLPNSKTGATRSTHFDANAVDTFDPDRKFAAWCVLHPEELAKRGLWMEDPRWTPGWVHLQRVPPGSGKRIYVPALTAPLASALPGQKPIPFQVK